MTLTIHTGKLSARKATAVKRRAHDLGLTTEEYLKQLIEDDLAISAKAKATSFDELAAPFKEALGHVSGEELDRRVKAARHRRRRRRRLRRNAASNP
jgi:hypothetical protein